MVSAYCSIRQFLFYRRFNSEKQLSSVRSVINDFNHFILNSVILSVLSEKSRRQS